MLFGFIFMQYIYNTMRPAIEYRKQAQGKTPMHL